MKSFLLIKAGKKELTEFLQSNFPIKDKIIFYLKPSKIEYSIEDIRFIKKDVFYQQSSIIIYILENFDQSSLEAQNALLKLLEEPPEKVFFILTAESQYHLLPTIISRTKIIFYSNEIKREKKDFIQNISQWPSFSSKEEALEYLKNLLLFLKNNISKKTDNNNSVNILQETIKISHLIKNNNLNYQLAIDHLLILIKKHNILSL
jgi:DNA polymerase III gamma/tau subunit